jgi:hypothetical protein
VSQIQHQVLVESLDGSCPEALWLWSKVRFHQHTGRLRRPARCYEVVRLELKSEVFSQSNAGVVNEECNNETDSGVERGLPEAETED